MNNLKLSRADRIFNGVLIVAFGLFTLICIYPFYYLIINTISANDISALGQVMFWPKKIHFQNYVDVFKMPGLTDATLISVLRTILGTVGAVVGSTFLGFMFTQEKMWGRKIWYRFVIISMYFNAGLIPWYITMRNLHLTNNFWAYILPAIVQPFNIILVKTYMESIPRALQESAEIDGAGILTVFLKIMCPLAKPIMATVAIFASVGQWNSFYDTLILMSKPHLYTLQFLLYQYINQASSLANMMKNATSVSAVSSLATQQTPTSIRMTVSVVVILPILLVYPFFQKYFVKGIMIGSVKG